MIMDQKVRTEGVNYKQQDVDDADLQRLES